jgi:CheY-like chemotaxis protein
MSDAEDLAGARAGMDGFMAKPITLERLDAALAEAAALAAPPAAPAAAHA